MSGVARSTLDAVREESGWGLVRVDVAATVVFVVVQVAATIAPVSGLVAIAVAVSLALFFAGCLAYVWAYVIGISRSREEAIGLGGLFFLADSAPAEVQRAFLAILAVQIVAAVVTAAVRVFTPIAFGILAPMFGLGVMALWGARYGTFPSHEEVAARQEAAEDEVEPVDGGTEAEPVDEPARPRRRRWWEPVDLDDE